VKPLSVILADHSDRGDKIEEVLRNSYGAEVDRCQDNSSFLRAKRWAAKSKRDHVMVACDFENRSPEELARKSRSGRWKLGLVADHAVSFPGCDYYLHIDKRASKKEINDALLPILGLPLEKTVADDHELPKLNCFEPIDEEEQFELESLKRQVRQLDPENERVRAERIIRTIVRDLVPSIERFTLRGLAPGYSGAKVFRVLDGKREYVLKLAREGTTAARECFDELGHYWRIKKEMKSSLLPLIPDFFGIGTGDDSPEPANCGDWLGFMTTFLDKPGDYVPNFEQVYLDPAGCTAKAKSLNSPDPPPNNPAEAFLEHIFRELEQQWYTEELLSDRKEQLWQSWPPPPSESAAQYHFAVKYQDKVIRGLDELNDYGKSLLGETQWKKDRKLILQLIGSVRPGRHFPKVLTHVTRLLLAPTHGDLNARNMFITLIARTPFLIDFASFKVRGHILQDFSMVEASVKYALTGREAAAPSGLDLTLDAFDDWCAAEARWSENTDGEKLAGWRASRALPFFRSIGKPTCQAYTVVRTIRRIAQEIHRSRLKNFDSLNDFQIPYNAALLYNTLRTIGFPSLPHLKRLYAVCSVRRIVECLRSVE
jgi:uncharacterized protein associated with vWA-MoxR-VMAP ternary system